MTILCRKILIFPQRSKKTTGQSGHKNSEQSIITKVIKTMEKRKQDKFYEFYSAYSNLNAWIFNDVTGAISQGTTVSTRIGMSIRLTHLKVRCTATIADATQVMRIIFFRWRVSDTADAPSDTELFAATGLGSNPVQAQILPVKPSRFQILRDVTLTMSTNWKPVQVLNFDLPLNWVTEYDIGVNTGKDHLYMATCSDSGAAPSPTWIHEFILHYHDTE
jgi:hypothetical protein